MLTSELLRYRAEGGDIRPYRLDRRARVLASRLIDAYRLSQGKKRSLLDRSLLEVEGTTSDVVVARGLSKLLEERAVFLLDSLINPEEVRKELFRRAAERGVVRRGSEEALGVLRSVAEEFSVSVPDVEASLFADLPEERLMIEFTRPEPEWLVDRYNLAQVQGLLYSATAMKCRFEGELRKIFTHLRLGQLMYTMTSLGVGKYELAIDGPVSLLRRTRRYGIRMAKFLPAVLLAKDYRIEAALQIRGSTYKLSIDPSWGLKSHYNPNPEFDSRIERQFSERFLALESPWKLEREGTVIDLGGQVMIPDFTFRHPDGRVAHLEIVGFWTESYLERKLKKLAAVKGVRLLVAVSKTLACHEARFSDAARILWFKDKLDPKDVLARLDRPSDDRVVLFERD
ncbi:MAG TPA: DUF790 family protein [Bdellovibrionota bacterium]|nr:DUF790 family protein [Bdellovibrionota bacterium]